MFWDSSAIVPVLFPEGHSQQMVSLLAADKEPSIWWGSSVECQSAIHRRHREVALPDPLLQQALARLESLVQCVDVVAATDAVRRRARRLLASHAIRAADALQLAAALVWCEEQPSADQFVCLDNRLKAAAAREGFHVVPAS